MWGKTQSRANLRNMADEILILTGKCWGVKIKTSLCHSLLVCETTDKKTTSLREGTSVISSESSEAHRLSYCIFLNPKWCLSTSTRSFQQYPVANAEWQCKNSALARDEKVKIKLKKKSSLFTFVNIFINKKQQRNLLLLTMLSWDLWGIIKLQQPTKFFLILQVP